MKKVTVVMHGCKGFANRLWNDMSVHAYALETGATFKNRTWLEHVWFLKPLHELYWRAVRSLKPANGVWVWTNWKLLPPSRALDEKFADKDTLYFFGWLFRNPGGILKHRGKLLELYGPNARETQRLDHLAAAAEGRVRIGIVMRQTPFPYFGDQFLVSPARTREIVDEYLNERGLTKEEVALVVLSDQKISEDVFADYAVEELRGSDRMNFFALSRTSVVIGTNTMFCNLAAWFGNIPHIVADQKPIDWAYYSDHQTYFENKYATFAYGSVTLP